MSNETKQAVYDAARAFVVDATSTDRLEAALAAHKADEKKPAAKKTPGQAKAAQNGGDAK